MLRVKTFVAESSGKGLGLFAAQKILKGEVTWVFDEFFDPSFELEVVNGLSEWQRVVFLKYGYFDGSTERIVLPIDDLRFINHSESQYNISSRPEVDVALRDIANGEELLCNYRHYEPDYFERRKIDPTAWE